MLFFQLCMYVVGIEVTLCGLPMEGAFNWAWGGAHQKWVQCPNPAGTIAPAAH